MDSWNICCCKCLMRSLSSCSECFGLRMATFRKLESMAASELELVFNSLPDSTRLMLAWCCRRRSWNDMERNNAGEDESAVADGIGIPAVENKSSLWRKLNVLVRFTVSDDDANDDTDDDAMLCCCWLCCCVNIALPIGHALTSIIDFVASLGFSSSEKSVAFSCSLPPVVSLRHSSVDDKEVDVAVACERNDVKLSSSCCCRRCIATLRKTVDKFSFDALFSSLSMVYCACLCVYF
jgi:hypothetical protein